MTKQKSRIVFNLAIWPDNNIGYYDSPHWLNL